MLRLNSKKNIVALLIIAAMLVSTLGVLAPKVHAQGPVASIIPASIDDTSLGPGSTFQINATGTDFTNLYTWQVSVKYNPSVLSVTGMTIPTSSIFNLPIAVSPVIDNGLGLSSIGASLITGSVSGSGVFTTVIFTVVGRGTTDITFGTKGVDTFFLDPGLVDIQGVTLQNGAFSNFVPPPTAKIYVNPSSIVSPALTEGQTFSVNLSIQSGTDVNGWAADLFFNKTLLSAVEGVEGPFLQNAGSTTFVATVQNDAGMVHLDCALTSGGASGNGDLATIRFTVLTTGAGPLTLANVTLLDPSNAALPFTTADGFFSNISVRDIAVKSVSTFNDVIAKGFMIDTTEVHISLNVTVVVVNNGDNNETFNVGIYVDSVLAAPTQLVIDLMPHEERTLEFLWDTWNATLGDHTLSASAEVLAGEIDTANNTFVLGQIKVIFAGDVNQDGIVDMRDVSVILQSFNAFYDNPTRFNHFADMDGNGRVEMLDIGIWAVNFGRHNP